MLKMYLKQPKISYFLCQPQNENKEHEDGLSCGFLEKSHITPENFTTPFSQEHQGNR